MKPASGSRSKALLARMLRKEQAVPLPDTFKIVCGGEKDL